MALPLPPDPYKALGVAKEATLAEIRSAHRKLVLKCHPDKVQDPTLKAQKADEFQKVQQAYELLSDDTKRQDYDEKIKMFSLRDTMRCPMPKTGSYAASTPAGVTVFDFEIRTAEPRSSRFKGARAPSPVRVYAHGKPRSFEDDLPTRMFEAATRSARKTASYEERKKTSSKDEERRRRAEEERERERWEKEMKKKDLSASKKSRDKERKKGSEEKTSRRTAYIVDDGDDSEGDHQPRVRKSSKKSDEKIRTSSENVRADEIIITDRTRKYEQHQDTAAQYITKMKAKSPDVEFRPRPVQRAETFQVPPYTSRYPASSQPYVEEPEEYVRRSSARPISRRTSDAPSPRSREPPRTSSGTEPFIVTAEPPSARKPSLQSHSSAPPIVPNTHERKEPQRSHTIQTEYVRRPSAAAPPPLPRAATFNDKTTSRPSHLHKSFRYSSDSASSDSDEETPYAAPRYASSPPRHKERASSSTRYFVEKGRSVPVVRTTHRKVMRDGEFEQERSESPRGTPRRSAERPPLTRTPPTSSARPNSSRGPYYGEEVPIVIPVRRGPPKRDSGGSTHSTPRAHAGPYFGEVKYAPRYSPEDVTYSEHYPKHYGKGGEGRGDYYPSPRRGEATYA